MTDVAVTVIGGRGPHGLAFHLVMQDLGLSDYRLVDSANDWLNLYGSQGPMQAVSHLRSPKELDFSLGKAERSMAAFQAEDGSYPLNQVYSLEDAKKDAFNETTTERQRAPRDAFYNYANCLAKKSNADSQAINARVTKLEPYKNIWRVHLDNNEVFTSSVILLATGLMPHLYIPKLWRSWWDQLPADRVHHAFKLDYQDFFKARQVAVIGSSNTATWEAATKLANSGANVKLLCRSTNPIERQLPFAVHWFDKHYIQAFARLSWKERQKKLKKPRIPASSLPGAAEKAREAGVDIHYYARAQYASELWGGVQLAYKTTQGIKIEQFDHIVAATGSSPGPKELSFLADAARQHKAPVIVDGVARNRPILDDAGRWKHLPPLYPLGSYALTRAGHAANTLASATVYLPLLMSNILKDAGLTVEQDDLGLIA